MHPLEEGIVATAEAEAATRRLHQLIARHQLDVADVERIVHQPEQLVAGRNRSPEGGTGPIEHAELAGERHRELEAYRPERMAFTMVVSGELLVPDDLDIGWRNPLQDRAFRDQQAPPASWRERSLAA